MSTDGGAVAAGDAGLARADAEEALVADHAEQLADEALWAWQDEQRRSVLASNPTEWWWSTLTFSARPGISASAVLVANDAEPGQPPEVMSRADVIALRDYLTSALEGTLPEVGEEPVEPGGEEPF